MEYQSENNEVEITCTNNGNVVKAEIDNLKERQSLDAFIATNKIHMKWNGSVYVGNAFGCLLYTSDAADE